MSDLVRGILADLEERDPTRITECSVHEDIVVDADPRLLRILLENLLGNAWKFSGGKPTHVRVGEEQLGTERVFFVRDRGVGFDMKQAQRLFAPFHRLHTETQFPGTGIGLATVQRIVARHGGRVWAEAVPGEGATFRFTLGERR